MASITISKVSEIYSYAQSVSLRQHRISCPGLSAFSRHLNNLRWFLREDADNDYWREVMWRCFWYRRLVSSAPLSPANPAFRGGDLLDQLEHHLDNCEEHVPYAAGRVRELLAAFKFAINEQDNPLLDTIIELIDFRDPSRIGILTAESQLLRPTQETLDRTPVLKGAEAVHVTELRSGNTFERLFFIGAGEWYGRGALSAPRAPIVDLLTFSFIRDDWKPVHVFVGRHLGEQALPTVEFPDENQIFDEELEPVGMLRADVHEIVRKIGGAVNDDASDLTLARLVLLEGATGVFLEADRDARAFVLDLDVSGEDRVLRLPVRDLDPAMFLLLRSQGGGDYIAIEADGIMGRDAPNARTSLKLWKTLLRSRVRDYGPGYVAQELERLGGRGVDANDVRRWMSPTTIGTSSAENFLAILRFTGLVARHDQFANLMRQTQNAHKQAGLRIRQLLLDEVEKADLTILQKEGIMAFKLPGEDAGSLTAYRILEIVKDMVPIAPSRLSRPFHVGDASWLA